MIETTRRTALELVGAGTAALVGTAGTAVADSETERRPSTDTQDALELPPPEAVLREARNEGQRTDSADLSTPGTNVVLPELSDDPSVERTDSGYSGANAGGLGRLAAAVRVAGEDVRLHYPEPDADAAGPWFVLEPLSGRIATVHTGLGRVRITMDYREPRSDGEPEFGDCLTHVRRAADPSHPYYPVDREVFTTGMMTYTLESVEARENGLTATFAVSTTPATTAAGVESRFSALDCVRDVSYEPTVELERASPSRDLREAVEAAHRTVVGDALYEWGPSPTVFSRLPTEEKLAFGTGSRGATEFSNEQYTTAVRLLSTGLETLRGDR